MSAAGSSPLAGGWTAAAHGLLERLMTEQGNAISQAAQWCFESISKDGVVHLFGSGHSRIPIEEMFPRYGSFPGFNPIGELSMTFHTQIVGANGQRQAMFLENVSGFAARILRNFTLSDQDTALIISSGGTNIVPIEMAEIFQQKNIKVVSILTKAHSEASKSKRTDGKKLGDFSDLILDTGAPVGDAMINIPNLPTPVAPGSTLGGVLIINSIKARVAALLTEAGHPPTVLSSANTVGEEEAVRLFESAYDQHAIRLTKLYQF
ncbi:MAG: hypothetical protein RL675_1083 [Bacteroidota bacterium]